MTHHRLMVAIAAIATVFALMTADAHARAGGGFSGGSRGMRTFSAPPATNTAPNAAAPMQRTLTQPEPQVRSAKLQRVRACSAAGCSVALRPAFSAPGYLACCLGTGSSVAWAALLQCSGWCCKSA